MTGSIFDFNLVEIFDWLLIVVFFFYLVFSAVVIWQIRRLILSVKTNLSTVLLILGLLNLAICFLCLVAAIGLL